MTKTTTSQCATQTRRFQIIGTDLEIIQAWEPVAGHSEITTIDGGRYGRIGTRRITAALDSMPRGDARIAAVGAFYEAQNQEAYQIIEATHADASTGRHRHGEIEIGN